MLTLDSRFFTVSGPPTTGLYTVPMGTPEDEVRAQVVNAVGADHPVLRELPLEAEVELLHRRVLHGVVDDVDARRACARKNEPGEGIDSVGAPGRKNPLGSR